MKNDFDLIYAKTLRLQYSSNPLIAYLNINPLQNNVDAIREITKNFLLHIFCIDETNLDDSFPDHQFKIDGYHFLHSEGIEIISGEEKLFISKMVL